MKTMDKRLGIRIRAFRKTEGLTTEQAARRMGVSRQLYERIEGGSCRITFDILSKAAEAFNTNVWDIMDRPVDRSYKAPAAVHGAGNGSSEKISDMLTLFYANKHMCERLQEESLRKEEGADYDKE